MEADKTYADTFATFELRVDLGNDACQTPSDVAGILRDAADKLEAGTDSVHGSLKDINGNRIGQFVLRP